MGGINERSENTVRGWLLVLCVLLLGWEPIRFGLVASNALPALSYRGAPLAAILTARVFVTALGVAAGLALVARRAPAVAMAKIALLVGAAFDIVIVHDARDADQPDAGRHAVLHCRVARVPRDLVRLPLALEARPTHVRVTTGYWLALSISSRFALNSLPGFHAGITSASATR